MTTGHVAAHPDADNQAKGNTMNKQLAAVATAVIALGSIGVAGAAPAAAKPAPRTLVFLSVHGPNSIKGPMQPGDDGVFLDDIYNRSGTTKLGTSAVHCVQNFGDILNCAGTAHLDGRGDLVFQGATQPAETFVMAIVGGTGEFFGANGEIEVFTVDENTDRSTVRLQK